MKNIIKKPQIVCFGEILWDNLPQGRKPGGAPMNVAYHLNCLNVASAIISRVGCDTNGMELLQAIKQLGLSTTYCQTDTEHPTSTVEVKFHESGEILYDIVNYVAWDYIEKVSDFELIVPQASAFVFGSLSGRNTITRETLNGLLDMASYKVFDINLRAPYFEKERIIHLLNKTNLLKINQDELKFISNWYSSMHETEVNQLKHIQDKFNISEIIVTKGSGGVTYYQGEKVYNHPAYKINVNDTVGSGDSFLAAFLSKKLQGAAITDTLSFASAVAAFVSTQSGACPIYTMADIDRFKKTHQLNT